MKIRAEAPGDELAIGRVTEAAFAGKPYSDQTEHLIVSRLRQAAALTISLVAETEGEIVGHVAFSPVTLSGGEVNWCGMGPVSVLPERQGDGIGSQLIRAGLEQLNLLGANGCVVVGSPKLYPKFGFRHHADLTYPDLPPEYFMILTLQGATPSGMVAFHPAFYGSAQ
ncbi:N-acetyltransferase [Rhizobium sp. RU36D]|uniref:GNAT family N-acetyltransferase n=1 Tax=Rhizobium sp. RU36D TaxID=1907415 RepID=UPI0009D7BA84|nr:N-acetyltransferase [Rhizobium sp. RU36D]SMC67651.1 putative acetyltransferase [Rhizobium sp. RU36D]